MKRSRWLGIAILFILISSLLPLAFTSQAQADSEKINLSELTNGADSILVGTVVERTSYWNDEHTRIYTSVAFSVEDRLKSTGSQDTVAIIVEGGEVEDIGEMVSNMPKFERGEKAVVFLKKLEKTNLPGVEAFHGQSTEEQFEVYDGYRGKFTIKGGRVDSLPAVEFKGRVNSILSGQTLPYTELEITPPSVTMPYSTTGHSWPHPPAPVVPYRINQNTSDCTGEGSAVQNAAATWSAAGANFSFSYAGTTTATAAGYDGVNAIMWTDLPIGTIAQATWWYNPADNTILQADIEFNDYYTWSASTSPTCPPGNYDVQSIGLHELGHWVGLADLYGSGDSDKVMYGYGSSGQVKRTLHPDDISGIQFIYGATQKLIGTDDASNAVGGAGANYFQLNRFLASATGNITEFRIKSKTNCTVKVAVYSDNSGQPDALLNAVNSSTPVSTGWNYITFPSTPVTQDTYYWLAFITDTSDSIANLSATSGTFKYKSATFSTFTFPGSAGTGFSSTSVTRFLAGWSSESPPPPTAPTVTNSTGASSITSSSARLNGEITSTGGENPTVHVYWGTINGGTTPANWQHDENLGTKGAGTFYADISSLTPDTPYYYRCFASNSAGSDWADSTETFTTPAGGTTQKLIGTDDASNAVGGAGANYFQLNRFLASATGNITEFRIKSKTNCNVKVAVYSDNSGQPDALLNAVDSSTPVSTGWNYITFPSTPVTQDTYYWLAFITDTSDSIANLSATSGTFKYKSATFSTFTFPGSVTGLSNASVTRFLAGWSN